MSYRNDLLGATSALVISLAASFAYGQTAVDGAVGGTVMDASGAVLSDASIKVKSNSTAIETTAITDESGYFRVNHLQPGAYTVTVTAPGFESYRSRNVTVQVGLLTDIPAKLAPGTASRVFLFRAQRRM